MDDLVNKRVRALAADHGLTVPTSRRRSDKTPLIRRRPIIRRIPAIRLIADPHVPTFLVQDSDPPSDLRP